MSNQNILIILEGKNPEQRIIKRINELFGLDLHISILFGSNIYKLYRTIENDQIIGTAALNTFELMKTACDITFEDHNRKIFVIILHQILPLFICFLTLTLGQ